jgi:hypothetical protein
MGDYKSVDLALEWSKQLMALSTGSLVLSATFLKDLFGAGVGWIALLLTSWFFFIACILFGMLFMGALCALADRGGKASIYSQPALALALMHFSSFALAMIAFTVFSALNVIAVHRTLL